MMAVFENFLFFFEYYFLYTFLKKNPYSSTFFFKFQASSISDNFSFIIHIFHSSLNNKFIVLRFVFKLLLLHLLKFIANIPCTYLCVKYNNINKYFLIENDMIVLILTNTFETSSSIQQQKIRFDSYFYTVEKCQGQDLNLRSFQCFSLYL